MRAFGVALGVFLAMVGGGAAAEAHAQTCTRPTDPAGHAGYAYGAAAVAHFDEARARVWYTTEGEHRVHAASTRPDGVPDEVARAAAVTQDALERYAGMGFRAPPSDEDTTCGSNGGDGRLDVYLVHFTAADGTAVPERCVGRQCASFILAESKLGERYPTADIGIRTVLPHEVFHTVQNGYDAEMDRFWAEGTAQWAAKTLDPTLTDLESFLPAFFREPSRSLDLPPGGASGAYLYGSAIWPVYLTETRGNDIVRTILEAEGADGSPALKATDAVVRPSSLATAFTRFAVWNTATGTRAMNAGYRDAKKYPMLSVPDFPAEGSVRRATSGLASFYYRLEVDAAKLLAFEGDPARTSATLVPLENGAARIDRATALSPASPTRVEAESIVVVSGVTTSKTDANFTLTLSTPPPQTPPPPVDHPPPPSSPNPDSGSGASSDSGGCSVSPSSPRGGGSAFAILLTLALFAAACGRTSSTKQTAAARIVSVGGPVTETVFLLGAGEQVVGVDTSSVHPDKANQLPHVGYQRTLGAEGVLSLTPTLVVAAEEAGPPAALEQIRGAGVRLEVISSEPSIAAARARIEKVGQLLDRDPKQALGDFDADVGRANALVAKATSHPKVLAIYARGQNLLHVFGTHSAADSMVRLAGGVNAVSGFDGSKPMAPEAMAEAAPDILLVPARGLESLGGLEGLAKVSGIAQTPAAKANRVVAMDDLLLLGFGPRTGQAIRELARKIHPELAAEPD
ncbi:ABC transporter substrate-binding protein [Pendulispora rubella]|uniref:ABC transporter substrate-binding protein n=1 Tax=Pendulispora rubella TaxID=2741070 RepID=A0ABZ2KW60_9BACT